MSEEEVPASPPTPPTEGDDGMAVDAPAPSSVDADPAEPPTPGPDEVGRIEIDE